MSGLRALAEAARGFAERTPGHTPSSMICSANGAECSAFREACSPDRILALLDVVDAARDLLEAAAHGYREDIDIGYVRDAVAALDVLEGER